MENAAKAIMIAGGVLIAIALLSVFAYLFLQMSIDTADIYTTMSESEITEFNQQFLNYDYEQTGGRKLTVQDVATLINLAQDNNETQKISTTITVEVEGSEVNLTPKNAGNIWLNEKMSADEETYYKCDVTIKNLLVSMLKIEPY